MMDEKENSCVIENAKPKYNMDEDIKINREEYLLSSAVYEIKTLREQNHTMSTRLRMFDDIMLLIKSLQPNRDGKCMRKDYDILSQIENHLVKPTSE